MEPVGIMACAIIYGPALHALGYTVGQRARYGLLVLNSADQGIIGVLGQIFVHFFAVEHGLAIIGVGALCGDLYSHGLAVECFFNHFKSQR